MINQFSRTELLLGSKAIETLKNAHVAIFGIGGVGGYVGEALARSGIGHFTIIDNDKVSLSNCNRQIIATTKTVGLDKVDVMKERILSINPDAIVDTYKCFFLPTNQDQFDFTHFDYIVDAIDTVSGKIAITLKAKEANVPVISSMGTGNKLNPMAFVVSDIYKTEMDPLAKVMRHELKKRHVKKLKVVYSKEKPIEPLINEDTQKEISHTSRRSIPGSNAFVPPAAGLLIASEVVKDLINAKKED